MSTRNDPWRACGHEVHFATCAEPEASIASTTRSARRCGEGPRTAAAAYAAGDIRTALTAYVQALREHRSTPERFERSRTLLALGTAQRKARQHKQARDTLQQALTTFEALGATLWAEKTRAELARIGGRAPSAGELTPSEQRIAEAVAAGNTNKEVAAKPMLSERTIESALTQIYRKLDIRSRTETADTALSRALAKRSQKPLKPSGDRVTPSSAFAGHLLCAIAPNRRVCR